MRISLIVATILATATAVHVAAAADMGAHPPVITADSVMPDETGFGWYLRGDVGFARSVAPTMSWQSTSYANRSVTNGASLGIGFGYRFTENLRSDLTLDFLTNHRVRGYLNTTDDDRLNQSAASLLANGYYDIGTYFGVTPYIGAGIGIARVNNGALTRDLGGIPTYTFAGRTQFALAAAATTGFSFDIGHGLQADVGYKFTWIDKTRTGKETTSTLDGPVTIGDFGSHQIRFGLKYFFN
jgi:opacity protein-like surface antigen